MIEAPPPEYVHPYAGRVVETIMSLREVRQYCRNEDALACTLFIPANPGDKCFVYLPSIGKGGVSPRTDQLLREHETAHCNGWPRNHPRASRGGGS